MLIERKGSAVALLSIDHGVACAFGMKPTQAIVHKCTTNAKTLLVGIDRKSLQVSTITGSARHCIANRCPTIHRNAISSRWGCPPGLGERVGVELPERFEGTLIDIEHDATMPRTARP